MEIEKKYGPKQKVQDLFNKNAELIQRSKSKCYDMLSPEMTPQMAQYKSHQATLKEKYLAQQ